MKRPEVNERAPEEREIASNSVTNREDENRRVLGEIIADIHSCHGLTFPVDKLAGRTEVYLEDLRQRGRVFPLVRDETHQKIAQLYGWDSDEAAVARVVKELGSDFDQLFLSQLAKKSEEAMTWRAYSPPHGQHLAETIDNLFKDRELKLYLEKNPETQQMLSILRELATTDQRDNLDAAALALEKLAVSQYQREKPTVLFMLSDWYMRPNIVSSESVQLLEPDCRLILPYRGQAYQSVNSIVRESLEDLTQYYPQKLEEAPMGIIGDAVMWAGAQLVAYTAGEAFNGRGFMLTSNIIKTLRSIKQVFQRSGLALPENLPRLLMPQYVRHELGHAYFRTEDPFLDEIVTDAATVMLYIKQAIAKDDDALTIAVALILGEYFHSVDIVPTGEANTDGYRISGITVVHKLLQHHLVDVLPDGRLQVHPDRANCERFIADLRLLHARLLAGDHETISQLRSVDVSDNIRQLLAAKEAQ